MFTKSAFKAAAVALLALAVINNVSALEPVKKTVNGDTGWF